MKRRLIPALALLIALPAVAAGQEPAASKKEERKTHTVKAGFFEVVEEVTATVESKNMREVPATVDSWTDLEIMKIVDEGTVVNAGDEIVWFETEDIDKKLKETRYALQIAELTLKSSQLDLDLAQNTFDLDVMLNERKQAHLEEDFRYFQEVDRPNRELSARRSVQNSQYSLEYAQEEYNQLKRMYDEDELTEESEEIVLKRTERDVENRQFFLEQARIRATRTLDTELPREAEQKQAELERARLEFEKSKIALPLERDKKQIAWEKAQVEFRNQQAAFEELQKDRERMTLKAPMAGVVYYGSCVRGKWKGLSGPTRELQTGSKAQPNKVLVTVVDPGQLMLRADLNEKQLTGIQAGKTGVATPPAFPKSQSSARVTRVNYIPVQEDKFDCQMELAEVPAAMMPGMTCQVRFVLAQKEDAITVPESAVFTNDGINHYVYVVEGDGQRQQSVQVGLQSDKQVEITAGLQAGVEILTERPQ
jgi:multidrug efflux pump subunit AcrA (membrane-fusion protein)